jgi:predicted fused transcriptional regulator/phosphomethylpyrimidine kinase
MPLYKGSEPLADYLTSHSIKYVAYSYAKEAAFSKSFLSSDMETDNTWVRNQADNAWDFQANLKELGNTRKIIYDDGDIFILDLSSRASQK